VAKLYNLARVTTATTGTGTITLGAAVSGCLTFAQAGAVDGDQVCYAIADGANAEIGVGTYTAGGATLSRDTILRSTGSGNNTAINLSGNAQVLIYPAAEFLTFVRSNIIYNGAMEIDQANEGAAITASDYVVDGWVKTAVQGGSGPATLTGQRDTAAPADGSFNNNLKISIGSSAYTGATQAGDYLRYQHAIEANEFSDTNFGFANANKLTLSFWIRTSVSGTWGATLLNAALNRSYINIFTTVGNVWKFVTLSIPGDTTGTWVLQGSAVAAYLMITLAAGSTFQGTAGVWAASGALSTSAQTQLWTTANATANLTGVKLEVGPNATPFMRLPFAQELARCQRYYEKSYDIGTAPGAATFVGDDFLYSTASGGAGKGITYAVPKRAAPTITHYSPQTGTSGKVYDLTNAVDVAANIASSTGTHGHNWYASASLGTVANFYTQWVANARL